MLHRSSSTATTRIGTGELLLVSRAQQCEPPFCEQELAEAAIKAAADSSQLRTCFTDLCLIDKDLDKDLDNSVEIGMPNQHQHQHQHARVRDVQQHVGMLVAALASCASDRQVHSLLKALSPLQTEWPIGYLFAES